MRVIQQKVTFPGQYKVLEQLVVRLKEALGGERRTFEERGKVTLQVVRKNLSCLVVMS